MGPGTRSEIPAHHNYRVTKPDQTAIKHHQLLNPLHGKNSSNCHCHAPQPPAHSHVQPRAGLGWHSTFTSQKNRQEHSRRKEMAHHRQGLSWGWTCFYRVCACVCIHMYAYTPAIHMCDQRTTYQNEFSTQVSVMEHYGTQTWQRAPQPLRQPWTHLW